MVICLGQKRMMYTDMLIYSYLAVPIGYLLGSIPSAYIIGRLIGKTDMRTEGDGRISAAAVKKRMGFWPFLLVVVMDICKGLLAIFIARLLTHTPIEFIGDFSKSPLFIPLLPLILVLATGFLTVIGHNWSPFIKFQGGLGATVIYGVLGGLMCFPHEIIALVIGGISVLITRKSGFSTGVIIVVLVIILLLQKLLWSTEMSLLLVFYPILLILLMVAKRFQVSKTRGIKEHDLFKYWANSKS
jgi:glycerol-3-phosphate acyltransferase PlsY